MNLVLVEAHELEGDGDERRVVLADHRARHLLEVLKVTLGARVRLGIVDGAMGEAEVCGLEPRGVVTLAIRDVTRIPPAPRVDLLLCLPRPKVLARLLSPIAQLGVERLFLSGAHRVERFYFDATILDPAVQRVHLVEGLAQARDTRLPRVSVHRSFAWLVRTELGPPREDTLRLYADVGEARSIREALSDARDPERRSRRVLLAVGPEGGFTDRERGELEAASFVRVGLGPRVLRSDVATIALLSLVHAELDAPA